MLIISKYGTMGRNKTFVFHCFSFILGGWMHYAQLYTFTLSICKACMLLRKFISWRFRPSSVFLNMQLILQVSMFSGRNGNSSNSSFISYSAYSLVMWVQVLTFLLAKLQLPNRPLSCINVGFLYFFSGVTFHKSLRVFLLR